MRESRSQVCKEGTIMAKSKAMTLRGSFDMTVGRATAYGASTAAHVFSYDSVDRTRAWRVTYASVWLQELLHGTGGGDSRAMCQWTLSTESLGDVTITTGPTAREWERRMGAGDNRNMAWSATDYQTRENVDADFLVPAIAGQPPMLLDVDRLVTNELWIHAFGVTEGSATLSLQANYYIEMELIKITSSESVLQQLKGQGQSVGDP